MNEFWLWFWRPIAETLGTAFMVLVLFGLFCLIAFLIDWQQRRRIALNRKNKEKQNANANPSRGPQSRP